MPRAGVGVRINCKQAQEILLGRQKYPKTGLSACDIIKKAIIQNYSSSILSCNPIGNEGEDFDQLHFYLSNLAALSPQRRHFLGLFLFCSWICGSPNPDTGQVTPVKSQGQAVLLICSFQKAPGLLTFVGPPSPKLRTAKVGQPSCVQP